MKPVTIAAVALIVLGLLSLGWGSFSFTKATHQATIGPLELSVKEKQTINIPGWAGGAAIVIGLVLLVANGRKG